MKDDSKERVQVLKADIQAGQQLPWHEGGPRVIYSLTDYTIRMKKNPDDTTTQRTTLSEGDVHWHDQNVHTVENIGDTKAEFLVFMRKPASFPEKTDVTTESDVQDEVPSDTNVLLENDAVKVIQVTLSSGEKVPMNTGTKRVIYSMNNYTIRFDTPDTPGEEHSFTEGDVHWHEGGRHSVNNIGDNPAEFLVVEFKK
ncbi:MAG: hypothetical protein GVY07_04850 [Bacteroidetes bacterium]|jgi:hypothetical protein|nr:hypothetical protein [Bacteroidota bacterium]